MTVPDLIDYGHGIHALDSGLGRPRLTAIHLLVEHGRAALIDTGSTHSVARVMDALRQMGIAPERVEYVILTHVHLDHAAGAGALLQQLPNARLTVHPRGVRHMVDPRMLVAGTIAVYGETHMQRAYGAVIPVAAERIIETPHGTTLTLGGRELVFLDTPGHARHHVAVWDARSRGVFAGDVFGLAYTELDDARERYIFPTTSPTQFDPDAAHRSVELLASLTPESIYVTHYGAVRDAAARAADLHRLIDAHRALALAVRGSGPSRHQRLVEGVNALVLGECRRRGWQAREAEVLGLMRDDVELNALGLACWLETFSG